MVNEDSNYKRVEDQKWRESVQSRLVSLTDSEVTQNDRLDEVDEEIHGIKEMLEGKSGDRDDNGIKGDLHSLRVGYNELRALMMPDHLGQGGVIARLRTLEKKAGIEEREVDNRWKFRTAIAGALIAAAVAILTNLDRIGPALKKFWNETHNDLSVTQKKPTERTSKKRRPTRTVVIETPTEGTDGTQEDVPEGRSGNGGHLE